eukprot:scaffold17.g536.t1
MEVSGGLAAQANIQSWQVLYNQEIANVVAAEQTVQIDEPSVLPLLKTLELTLLNASGAIAAYSLDGQLAIDRMDLYTEVALNQLVAISAFDKVKNIGIKDSICAIVADVHTYAQEHGVTVTPQTPASCTLQLTRFQLWQLLTNYINAKVVGIEAGVSADALTTLQNLTSTIEQVMSALTGYATDPQGTYKQVDAVVNAASDQISKLAPTLGAEKGSVLRFVQEALISVRYMAEVYAKASTVTGKLSIQEGDVTEAPALAPAPAPAHRLM